MSLFEHYDSVRIVSLRERRDRRRAMTREMEKFGIKPDFFDAYQSTERGLFRSVGSNGCYHSHLQILEEASAKKKSVLILQDDCKFLPAMHSFKLPKCDIFYGSHAEDADEIIGAHFMGFSRQAARLAAIYLRNLLDPSFPPDLEASQLSGFNPAVRPPIDGALVWFRRANPELHTEFALLAVQRRSRSDITPRNILDQIPLVRDLLGRIRHLSE